MFHVLSFQKNLNRVFLNSVFFCFVLYLFNSYSYASSVSNFGQWKNLNSLSKTTYTAGVVDTFLHNFDVSENKKKIGISLKTCLDDFRITIFEIANMIDIFYQNKKNWASTPQDAIIVELINGHCFNYIDQPNGNE